MQAAPANSNVIIPVQPAVVHKPRQKQGFQIPGMSSNFLQALGRTRGTGINMSSVMDNMTGGMDNLGAVMDTSTGLDCMTTGMDNLGEVMDATAGLDAMASGMDVMSAGMDLGACWF